MEGEDKHCEMSKPDMISSCLLEGDVNDTEKNRSSSNREEEKRQAVQPDGTKTKSRKFQHHYAAKNDEILSGMAFVRRIKKLHTIIIVKILDA